jgi:hypothetical protein
MYEGEDKACYGLRYPRPQQQYCWKKLAECLWEWRGEDHDFVFVGVL